MMVQNTNFGGPEKLPFDLKVHRILTYKCAPNSSLPEIKKELGDKLIEAIRLPLDKRMNLPTGHENTLADNFQKMLSRGESPIALETEIKTQMDQVLSDLKNNNIYSYNDPVTSDELIARKTKAEFLLRDLISIYFNLGRWSN